jgi:hypothetical protein
MPLKALRNELLETVLGSREAVDLLLTSLLANGHALVTGPPGDWEDYPCPNSCNSFQWKLSPHSIHPRFTSL